MPHTWHKDDAPDRPTIGAIGWLRALVLGGFLILVLGVGLVLLLLVRLIERPIWGPHRPLTPHITQAVCQMSLSVIGLDWRVQGALMVHPGGLVANHSSWVDIFVLNAVGRVYFVSKSEVASWPGIGWLARATGTVFIRRMRSDAKAQNQIFQDRLIAGHQLLFFPEGTSSDGSMVLPFKSTLFQAFFAEELRADVWLQPVGLNYHAPTGQDARFYGWWGDMDFGPHLFKLLAVGGRGIVDIGFGTPLKVADHADRKELAKACEQAVKIKAR